MDATMQRHMNSKWCVPYESFVMQSDHDRSNILTILNRTKKIRIRIQKEMQKQRIFIQKAITKQLDDKILNKNFTTDKQQLETYQ